MKESCAGEDWVQPQPSPRSFDESMTAKELCSLEALTFAVFMAED